MNDSPSETPAIAVIVPVGQSCDTAESCIRSLFAQDIRGFEVILCTERPESNAATLCDRLVVEASRSTPPVRCRHIVAGAATRSCQKNANLLAGIASISPGASLIVFCDSTRVAEPGWLRALVAPITEGDATVASGYHVVVPTRDNAWTLPAAMHAVIAAFLGWIRMRPSLSQPWGGATAIRRTTFDAMKVNELWQTAVVDDVSLARRMKDQRMPMTVVTDNPLKTHAHGTWAALFPWLLRQIIYLRFYFPGTWMGIGFILLTTTCALLPGVVLPVICCRWIALAVPPMLFVLASISLARPLPVRPPMLLWIAASLFAIPVALLAFVNTLFSRSVKWAGHVYAVSANGTVLGVRS